MVLKHLGKVPTNYYELQHEYDNRELGFEDFNGRVIEGVTFERRYPNERNKDFPIEELLRTIDAELSEGRLVIISIYLREMNAYHMWLIYQKKVNDYAAFSKAFDIPDILPFPPPSPPFPSLPHLRAHIENMGGTDILVYREE